MAKWKTDNSGPFTPASERTDEFKLEDPTDYDKIGLHMRSTMGSESVDISEGINTQRVVTDAGTILYVYTPETLDANLTPIVFYHGGGWVGGAPLVPQNFLKHLAQISQRTVINVDYALAPEKKGKWAVEECYAVLAWLTTDAADFVSSKQFIIGGDSAGANLVGAVSYLNAKNNTHYVEKQFMFYPVLTMDVDQTKDITWDIDRFGVEDADIKASLSQQITEIPQGLPVMQHIYAGGEDVQNPIFSPLMMDDAMTAKMPKTLVVTDQFDLLRPQGEYYADKLAQVGVDATLITYLGQEHAFLDKYGLLPQGEDATHEVNEWLLSK
ncbi:alpha/beta hydrolase [Weissella viridescens]|uniref:Alpha/beta hydrolase n=1 Tax=Weissella viridescens TaxID=1629 RepID=A0A3P2RJ06_WEIVI|nr:alpha/beta hydrolase [Weissella viridescens]RRG18730.1 alpha/beta hydrolase [Weissella viridescens]